MTKSMQIRAYFRNTSNFLKLINDTACNWIKWHGFCIFIQLNDRSLPILYGILILTTLRMIAYDGILSHLLAQMESHRTRTTEFFKLRKGNMKFWKTWQQEYLICCWSFRILQKMSTFIINLYGIVQNEVDSAFWSNWTGAACRFCIGYVS